MVAISDTVVQHDAVLFIQGKTVEATVSLTESGSIEVNIRQDVVFSFHFPITCESVKGLLPSGEYIHLKNVVLDVTHSIQDGISTHILTGITHADEFVIDEIGDHPFVGASVNINFDMLCFVPIFPSKNIRGEYSSISGSTNNRLILRPNWKANGILANEIEDRIDLVKEQKTPIKTSTLKITQSDQNGPPDVQIDRAWDRVHNISDLLSFLHGVGSAPIRVVVEKHQSNGTTLKYTQAIDNSCNVGSAYSRSKCLEMGDTSWFLDEAYDKYSEIASDYKLRSAIGFYLNAINPAQTLQGQLSALFCGIELLAKRHSDYGPDYRRTKQRMEYMMNNLNVEVDDLAKYSPTFPNEYINNNYPTHDVTGVCRQKIIEYTLYRLHEGDLLSDVASLIEKRVEPKNPIPEYFYSKCRQHIIHGDNQSTYDGKTRKLFLEYNSVLCLMQRVIRNHLLGTNSNKHRPISHLEPDKLRDF